MSINGLGDLFSIIIAASKDKIYIETAEKMQIAFHDLIMAEANSRRDKTATIIRSMAKIDCEAMRFQREYKRISEQLSPEALNAIENYLKLIEKKKKELVFEKNEMKQRR